MRLVPLRVRMGSRILRFAGEPSCAAEEMVSFLQNPRERTEDVHFRYPHLGAHSRQNRHHLLPSVLLAWEAPFRRWERKPRFTAK